MLFTYKTQDEENQGPDDAYPEGGSPLCSVVAVVAGCSDNVTKVYLTLLSCTRRDSGWDSE